MNTILPERIVVQICRKWQSVNNYIHVVSGNIYLGGKNRWSGVKVLCMNQKEDDTTVTIVASELALPAGSFAEIQFCLMN